MPCAAPIPASPSRRLIHETIRRMINTLVTDLIRETEKNIRSHAVRDIWLMCGNAPAIAAFSAEMHEQNRELKPFCARISTATTGLCA